MRHGRRKWIQLGLTLLLVAMLCSLPGCDGSKGKNDFLIWLEGLWATWSDVAVHSGMGPVLHLLGYPTVEIAGSALTDVGTAAAPVPAVFSCNVDLGAAGGYDYDIVLFGTVTAAPGGGAFHIVCDTPEPTRPTTDTVTLDLTPNEDNTQLSGTLTFTHDGEDATGDVTFSKAETP